VSAQLNFVLLAETPARQLKYRNNLKTQLKKPCHAARAIIKSAQLKNRLAHAPTRMIATNYAKMKVH
jgi:hypothetical protein